MKKLFVIILILAALFMVFYAANYAFTTGTEDAKKTNEKLNKAADENVKGMDDPNRPRDRGYGSEMKKRAYDKSKKAYETPGRQLDKFEKDSADPAPAPGGGSGD
jgi:hypothetical protein